MLPIRTVGAVKRGYCASGKLRHASKAGAEKALLAATTRAAEGNRKRKECRTYQCWGCGGWHLTSVPNKRENIVQRLSRTLSKEAA